MSIDYKAVIIVDPNLSLGFLANAIAATALSLGSSSDNLCGPDFVDADGNKYQGITSVALPILKADADRQKTIRRQAFTLESEGLVVIDFTDLAQKPHDYAQFSSLMERRNFEDLSYRSIGLFGPKKIVNKLTGNLPLLR